MSAAATTLGTLARQVDCVFDCIDTLEYQLTVLTGVLIRIEGANIRTARELRVLYFDDHLERRVCKLGDF